MVSASNAWQKLSFVSLRNDLVSGSLSAFMWEVDMLLRSIISVLSCVFNVVVFHGLYAERVVSEVRVGDVWPSTQGLDLLENE